MVINVTDMTLGATERWLETRTGGGGTSTLAKALFYFINSFWLQPLAPWTGV
jgi:hypothetical protein